MSSPATPRPRLRAAWRRISTSWSHWVRSRAMTSTGTRSRASKATSARRAICASWVGSTYTARFCEPRPTGTGSWKGEPRQVFRNGGTSKKAARYVPFRKVRSASLPMEPLRPRMRWYLRKTRGRDMTKSRSWKRTSLPRPSWKLRHSSARDQAFGFARPDWSAQYRPSSFTYTKSSLAFIAFPRCHSWVISRITRSVAGCGELRRASRSWSGEAPLTRASATEVAISLSSWLG
mmetsp:Transcript_20962/g.55520  ORF Transcript_20962/g.55520 Transcript_20962/m.55520 type:complete len:234 (+) Transcript_20962:485-1186(+)